MSTTDSLLEQAVVGDEAAFESLHHRFADRLERYIASRMSSRARERFAPEDVAQEVFADVFTRAQTLQSRGKGTFYRLLLTVARRRLIDIDRRLAVRPDEGKLEPHADGAPGGPESIASQRTGPLTLLLRREEQEVCRRAFQELPESYRRVLHLRLVEERSALEISKLTGKSEGAVWVWFHRALQAWYARFEALRGK
jgi:RNA polymerase sigma-70 factor (ECF subfamily)